MWYILIFRKIEGNTKLVVDESSLLQWALNFWENNFSLTIYFVQAVIVPANYYYFWNLYILCNCVSVWRLVDHCPQVISLETRCKL